VLPGGQEVAPVAAEADEIPPTFVDYGRGERFACSDLPQLYGPVLAARMGRPAIIAKADIYHLALVLKWLPDGLARGDLPEPSRLMFAAREEKATVGTEGDRTNAPEVLIEVGPRLALPQRRQSQQPFLAASQRGPAVRAERRQTPPGGMSVGAEGVFM